MTDTAKRYYDLKADFTRVEINLQELDKPLVVTGPVAVDETDASTIFALDNSPGVKTLTPEEYKAATKAAAASKGGRS